MRWLTLPSIAGACLLFMGTMVARDQVQCQGTGTCPRSGDCTITCADTACSDDCSESTATDSTGQFKYCQCGTEGVPACCQLIYRKSGSSFRKARIKGDCPSCPSSGLCKKTGKGPFCDGTHNKL